MVILTDRKYPSQKKKRFFLLTVQNPIIADIMMTHVLYLMQQTTILENQFGLPSLVDKATANTTNLVASASSSMTPDEIGGEKQSR